MSWLLLLALADITVAAPATKQLDYIVPAKRALPFYEGKAERFWTPSSAEIDRLRPKLARLLSVEQKRMREQGLRDLNDYARQYVGVFVKGKKRIWVYGFRAELLKEKSFRIDQPAAVDDGGCGFWRVELDVATGNFSPLSCNGEA